MTVTKFVILIKAATHRNQAFVPKHISASPQDRPSSKSLVKSDEILVRVDVRRGATETFTRIQRLPEAPRKYLNSTHCIPLKLDQSPLST